MLLVPTGLIPRLVLGLVSGLVPVRLVPRLVLGLVSGTVPTDPGSRVLREGRVMNELNE